MNVQTVLSLLAALPIMVFAQENLVENPGFEEGAGPWKVPQWALDQGQHLLVPTQDTTQRQGNMGHCSLKFEVPAAGYDAYLPYNKTIKLDPNVREYTLGFWLKSEKYREGAGAKGHHFLRVTLKGKDKKDIAFAVETPWNKQFPQWTYFSKDFTVPEGYETAGLLINIATHKNPTGVSRFDNIYFGPKIEKTAAVENLYKVKEIRHAAVHDGVYYPGEPILHKIILDKKSPVGDMVQIRWKVLDFYGKEFLSGSKDMKLDAVTDFPLELPKDFRGYYVLKTEIYKDNKYAGGIEGAGMVIEPMGERDPFFSNKGCGREKHVRMGFGSAVLRRGGGMIRSDSEDEPGQYNWNRWFYDNELKRSQEEGYTNLYGVTCFYNGNCLRYPVRNEYREKMKQGIDVITDQELEGYRLWARALIARYGKYVSNWRVPDEVTLTRHANPFVFDHYVKFCKIFYEELKKQYPESKLYAGGELFGQPQYQELTEKIWDKIKDHVDGLCSDYYPQQTSVGVGMVYLGPEQTRVREKLLLTIKTIGYKDYVNEEMGSGIQMSLPLESPILRDFAKITARTLILGKSIDQVKAWTWFMVEDSSSAWNGEFDYGMWKLANPRSHALAYARVARELAFAQHAIEVKPHADIYAYVFEKKGRTLITIWALTREPITAKIDLPADWNGRDLVGNPFSGKKGIAELRLSDAPIFIDLAAPQKEVADCVAKGAYSMPLVSLALNRKDGKNMNVLLLNRTNEKQSVKLTFNGKEEKSVEIEPLATLAVPFAAEKLNARNCVTAQVGDNVYRLEKQEEILFVERLEKAPAMDGTLVGFDLSKPSFVFKDSSTLWPIDAAAWGYWTGEADSSAKVYLAYDKDAFYVAADVQDDVPVSRASDAGIWNQDCLQYGFDTENDAYDPETQPAGYMKDDREFCMALTPKGPQNFCYTAPAGQANTLVADKVTITVKDGHTIYVGRIPWNYLGNMKPVPGTVFGFNTVIFDIDQKNGVIPYRMELSRGIANGKGPAYFKRFILK